MEQSRKNIWRSYQFYQVVFFAQRVRGLKKHFVDAAHLR